MRTSDLQALSAVHVKVGVDDTALSARLHRTSGHTVPGGRYYVDAGTVSRSKISQGVFA